MDDDGRAPLGWRAFFVLIGVPGRFVDATGVRARTLPTAFAPIHPKRTLQTRTNAMHPYEPTAAAPGRRANPNLYSGRVGQARRDEAADVATVPNAETIDVQDDVVSPKTHAPAHAPRLDTCDSHAARSF